MLLLTLAALWSLGGCEASPVKHDPPAALTEEMTMLELGERNDGGIAAARVGDVLTVQLPENASTGYRWAIDRIDPEKIELVETSALYPASAAVGSGGDTIFRFKAKTAGESKIALKYWRQWEGDKSVIKRFTVTVMAAR